jgi:hypothetical protein
MRLFEMFITESMTMWVPDAPRATVQKECWVCDGTGIDGFINKAKRNQYYPANELNLRERLKGWDKRLPQLFKLRDDAERSIDWMEHFLDSNPNLPSEVNEKARKKIADGQATLANVNDQIDLRMDRIEKKLKLVKGLDTIPCEYCHGKTYTMEDESDAPELNLANSNMRIILQILGLDPEGEGWHIEPGEIPALKRRLMVMMNTDELDNYGREASDTQQDFGMVRTKDPETGLDKIERKKGARMIDMGLDKRGIIERLTRIMPIINYAQKHNMRIVIA